jgi:autotransporter-associated beta strand protein
LDPQTNLAVQVANTFTSLNISDGTVQVARDNALGGGAVTIGAAGSLNTTATFSTARTFTINGGTFNVNTGATTTLTGTVNGTILNKSGGGGLTLSGAKTYTGGTNIINGRISVTANGHIPVGSLITQSGTAQLFLNATGVNFTNDFSISGLGFVESSGFNSGSIRSDQSNTFSGQISVSGTPRIGSFKNTNGGSGTNTISGKITGNAGIDFFGLNGNNNLLQTFVLSNALNDYTGVTSITSGDHGGARTGTKTILKLGASNVIPNGVSASNIAFNGADADHLTILDMAGFNETVNGFTVAAAAGAQIINSTGTTSTLTTGDNNTTSTFSGTISNVINLTKTGTGTLTLSGNNTYSGTTSINDGTLLVNGLHTGGGLVTINAGGTLGGSGRINSEVTGAGLASPGNSPGILTVSQTNPTGGMDFAFQMTAVGDPDWSDSANSLNDVWRITHATTPFTASLTAANVVDVYFAAIADGDVFRGGFFTDRNLDFFVNDIDDATYNFWVLGGSDTTFEGDGYYSLASYDPLLTIDVSTVQVASANFAGGDPIENGWVTQFSVSEIVTEVVPEPSSHLSWLLLGAAAVAGGTCWRRRNAVLALTHCSMRVRQ